MPSPSSRGSQGFGDMGRFAGLGLTFAMTIAVLGALGWWLDGKFDTLPWLLVTGVIVGAVGGFVRIVKAVPGNQSFTPQHAPLSDDASADLVSAETSPTDAEASPIDAETSPTDASKERAE